MRNGRLQLCGIDTACDHDGTGFFVVNQRKQQMLECRIFVLAASGCSQGVMESGFEITGKGRHQIFLHRSQRARLLVDPYVGCPNLADKTPPLAMHSTGLGILWFIA